MKLKYIYFFVSILLLTNCQESSCRSSQSKAYPNQPCSEVCQNYGGDISDQGSACICRWNTD